MNTSQEHNNWITVGEVINLIKKPVASYTSQVVGKWHAKLLATSSLGKCTNPANCKTITQDPKKLCLYCKGWYDELCKSHRSKYKPQMIKCLENCDPSMWSADPWEVAKFFMPFLGDNKATVKDAQSTDLGSLLNVLDWMKDLVFAPDRRVNLSYVKDLRSKVRNPWAHAPNQEFTQADRDQAFDIAIKFVDDVNKVYPCAQVEECLQNVQLLKTEGLTNVAESELRVLLKLSSDELRADIQQMKEDILCLKQEQNSDRHAIEENERKLNDLEDLVEKLRQQNNYIPKSCIPDKPGKFIGRGKQVERIIFSIVKDNSGIVSIVGGPGFGKSTIAVIVSHRLKAEHDIVVIFSLLSNASTVEEVILRLCLDFGVDPGKDPESSLMMRLKRIENRVLLVMDNIEQLLKDGVKTRFDELIATLRKNSDQKLQLLTTTRIKLSDSHQTIEIRELDKEFGVKLLKTYCNEDCDKEVTDRVTGQLSTLAELCGYVPLALCLTGSQIPDLDDLDEMIEWLKNAPMEALESPDDSDQSVRKAIEFSFKMLDDEDKQALVRLSVFPGNFEKKSAQEVIERKKMLTQRFLKKLEARSLIQSSVDKRFVIHPLIRRFLADHDQFQDAKHKAEEFMVKYFLEVCHSLTMESYSKDKFTHARKSLKDDVHNIEETLKMCSHDETTEPNPIIVDTLAGSDIYSSSSRFFYNFCWVLLPQKVLKDFHETCARLAESQNDVGIKITFQCLVADQEGRECGWKSTPEFIDRMKNIKKAFDENELVLKDDRTLFLYCYYFCARNYKAENTQNSDLPESDLPEKCFVPSPESKERSNIEKVDGDILISIQRGNLYKNYANKIFKKDEKIYEQYMEQAEEFYDKALESANELLGDHESTCICQKLLGDLYLNWRKNEKALHSYSKAIELRERLQLNSNEPFVFLLKNCGCCLSYLHRYEESVEKLEKARKIADQLLADKKTAAKHCRAKLYCELARNYRKWKPDCQEAAKYAKVAIEMRGLLKEWEIKCLEDIIIGAQENMGREDALHP